MQAIYLVCGVPASGKSWVLNQLSSKYQVLHNDDFINGDYAKGIAHFARNAERPVLCDCPFGERALKQELQMSGFKVIPLFIVEDPETVKKRYETRSPGKPCPQNVITRATSIKGRADEWNAFSGSSNDVLDHLKAIAK